MTILRKILGKTEWNRETNEKIRKTIGSQEPDSHREKMTVVVWTRSQKRI